MERSDRVTKLSQRRLDIEQTQDFYRQFASFSLCKLQVTLICEEAATVLPEFHGSLLRGAFLIAFRELHCIGPTSCNSCEGQINCLYHRIFEARLDKHELRGRQDAPHPILFQPRLKSPRQYYQGDELTFQMTLVGQSVRYLPEVIRALQNMGQRGLGARRTKFRLERIEGSNGVIYEAIRPNTIRACPSLQVTELLGDKTIYGNMVQVESITPLRLKKQARLQDEVTFELLIRALIRRVEALMVLYGPGKFDYDWMRIQDNIRAIQGRALVQQWYEITRYSNRQNTRMNMGGVMGVWQFTGDLVSLAPLLYLGSHIGVGKCCVFGLGQYKIHWLKE